MMKKDNLYLNFVEQCNLVQKELGLENHFSYSNSGWHFQVAKYLFEFFNYRGGNITYYKLNNTQYKKAEDHVTVPTWINNRIDSTIENKDWKILREVFKEGELDEEAFFNRKGKNKGFIWRFDNTYENPNKAVIIQDGELSFLSLILLLREVNLPNKESLRKLIFSEWVCILGLINTNNNEASERGINLISWLSKNSRKIVYFTNEKDKVKLTNLLFKIKKTIYNKNSVKQYVNVKRDFITLIELFERSFNYKGRIGINVRGHLALRCTKIPNQNCIDYFPQDIIRYLETKENSTFDDFDLNRGIVIIELKDYYNSSIPTSFIPVYLGSHINPDLIFKTENTYLSTFRSFLKFICYSDILNIIERNDYTHLLKEKELAVKIIKAKDIVISKFNHDITTPINALKDYFTPSNNKITPEDVKNMSHNVELLSIYTENIIYYSNILNNKPIPSHISDVDLETEINNIVGLFTNMPSNSNIASEIFVQSKFPIVLLDRHRFIQIAINLIGNAFKYTNNGKIRISLNFNYVHKDKEFINIYFQVKDTGIGISDFDKKKIFTPYFRGSNIKIEGIGLGLSIVKDAVKVLKGKINLESELEKGSVFTIMLPKIKIQRLTFSTNNQSLQFFDNFFEKLMLELNHQNIPFVIKDFRTLVNDFYLPYNNTKENLVQVIKKLKEINKGYSLKTLIDLISYFENSVHTYSSAFIKKTIELIIETPIYLEKIQKK